MNTGIESKEERLITILFDAMVDLVRQLPIDERLADYNLTFCEYAEQKFNEWKSSPRVPNQVDAGQLEKIIVDSKSK